MNDMAQFQRLVEALAPWHDRIVFVGGWAHRLYRAHPLARVPNYPPLTTKDADIAFPSHARLEGSIRDALLHAGFREELLGDNRPPVSHYTLGDEDSGFYAEFLTPLTGSGIRRSGEPDATTKIAGVTAQKLRHLDVLLVQPWQASLAANLAPSLSVPNPVSFVMQRILIRNDRKPGKRAQDALYIHDTLELFAGEAGALTELWREHVAPSLTRKQRREIELGAHEMFSGVGDTLRDAAVIAQERGLAPERIRSLCDRVLRTVFE